MKSPLDVTVIDTVLREDSRGSFSRLFCQESLKSYLNGLSIVQINYSKTIKPGTIRGLHFQHNPHAEIKCVRCLKGKVWDVAVDLRENSKTRFQWFGVELSGENNKMVIIPEGFAHGFQVLEPNSELLYLHTAFYTPEAEGGIHALDPHLNISWPLEITEMSERDKNLPKVVL